MQIFSTSAMSGGGPAATAMDRGSSRAGAAGDFGSVLSAMNEADATPVDAQDDETIDLVAEEDSFAADDTKEMEQEPPTVGLPGSLTEARKSPATDLQASGFAKTARDSGYDIASRSGREGASADMLDTLPHKGAAATLADAKNQSVAESSLTVRATAAVKRTDDAGEVAQFKSDFAAVSLRRESASDPITSSPPTAGNAIRPATQGIEILVRHPDKLVEISLNPEELGRVRMAMSRTEHGMTVAIMAERPEALDLMRRHIDQLTAEFHRLGYTNIGFSFGNDTQHGPDRDDRHRQDKSVAAIPADTTQPTFVINRPVTNGLDLRL